MGMDTLLTIVMLAAGLVVILGALPMALGRLRPNHWYGYRTPASLASKDVWDQTNRTAGRWLLAVGALVIVATLTLRLLEVDPATSALSTTALLMLGVLTAGARAYAQERRHPAPR